MLQGRKLRFRVGRAPRPSSPLPTPLGRSELPLVTVESGSSALPFTVPPCPQHLNSSIPRPDNLSSVVLSSVPWDTVSNASVPVLQCS